MAKEKYKLQTPGYIKDSTIVEAFDSIQGFNKSNLSNAKAGREVLSQERLIQLYHLISAIQKDLPKYREYIFTLIEGNIIPAELFSKFYYSLSKNYKENHKIIDK